MRGTLPRPRRSVKSSLVFAFLAFGLAFAFAFGWMGEEGRKSTEGERWVVRPKRGEGLELDEITGEEGWKKEGGSWSEWRGLPPSMSLSRGAREFLFPGTALQSGRSLAGPPAIEDARRPTRLAGGRASRSGTHSHAAREREEGQWQKLSLSLSLSLSPLFLFSELV